MTRATPGLKVSRMDFDGMIRYVVHDATGKVSEMSDGIEGLSLIAQATWAQQHPDGSALPPPDSGPEILPDDGPTGDDA